MPTKKKRVGFIPREDVMKIIFKLSVENNLSISKIISILVEEALSTRGIFDKRTGKLTQSYENIIDLPEYLSGEYSKSKNNEKVTRNTNLKVNNNSGKTNLYKQTNVDSFDLQTYKKFLSFLKFQEMMDEYKT